MSHPRVPPRNRLLWAAIDLDGTLAEPLWTPSNPTSDIGAPIEANMQKARALVEAGLKLVVHTSRPDSDYEGIESWLNFYGLPFRDIRTGKVLAAVYVDDRAVHASETDWLAAVRRIANQ